MRIDRHLIVFATSVVFLCSCGGGYEEHAASPHKDTMDISSVVVALPDSPGRDLVEMSCVPCHSLRYIEMQPDMTRKSWDKIVIKMIKNYGAPVRDSVAAAAITDYLFSVKGKK